MSTAQLNDALTSNYLLASLSLRSWSGKRTDKSASDEVIASKQAVRNAGVFVKNLMASAQNELDEVHRLGTAIRNYVYTKTLPWSASQDGARRGERLLPSSQAMDFLAGLNQVKQEYDAAVIELARVWDQRVLEAQRNLGALADPTQYPSSVDLPKLFSVTVDLAPIPAVADFTRLNVPAALADALGQRHQEQAELQVRVAMDDLRERFASELGRFETQMSKHGAGEKTRLYDTLITNMQGLCELARSMNITGNAKLTELADRIEDKLLRLPIEMYRHDMTRAKAAAAEASELQALAAVDDVWSQI